MLILDTQIFYINQKNDRVKLCKSFIDINPENITTSYVINSLPLKYKDDIKLLENINYKVKELIV